MTGPVAAPVPRIPWDEVVAPDGTPRPAGARRFGDALRHTGFAILTGAPLDRELLEANYELARRVFALGPELLERKYSRPELGYQRGYMPTGTEVGGRCGGEPDEKEVMAFGPYRNVAVEEVPGYLEAAEAHFARCRDLGYALVRALALYLDPEGLEHDRLLGLFRAPDGTPIDDSHMRHIRYPGDARRMACEHTDSNVLSLLPAATGRGLEVRGNDGVWRAVETAAGDLVVNAGDMLNLLSGGAIRSTLHRVENRLRDPSRSRYAIPFFYHPDHAQELWILASCRHEPAERRMFPCERITGYRLLYELLAANGVIPADLGFEAWRAGVEALRRGP